MSNSAKKSKDLIGEDRMLKEDPAQVPQVIVEAIEAKVTAKRLAGAKCMASMADVVYSSKESANYNPRVSHTQEALEKINKCMGIKQSATHKELCDALATHFTKTDENHHDFIGYMVRRKVLHIVK